MKEEINSVVVDKCPELENLSAIEKYMGILDSKFFIDMLAERDTLSYNEEASRKKLKEIRQGYGNNPIPSDHAIVRKLHPDVWTFWISSTWGCWGRLVNQFGALVNVCCALGLLFKIYFI